MTSIAPSCPVSYSEVTAARILRNDPRTRPGMLHDMVNRIPRAHDLPSAINALNIMNNIITMINRSEPTINNLYPPGGGGVILKGEDNNPHYQQIDWVLEGRGYNTQKLKNPDDEDRYVEIKTLKVVYFYNANTDYRLNYDGPLNDGF